MYDSTLNRRRKIFCCYCLQTFNTEEVFKNHGNGSLKVMVNK